MQQQPPAAPAFNFDEMPEADVDVPNNLSGLEQPPNQNDFLLESASDTGSSGSDSGSQDGSESGEGSEGSGSFLSEEDVYLPEILNEALVSSSGKSISNIMEDISKSLAALVEEFKKSKSTT